MSLDEIKVLCVDQFSLSTTRAPMFANLVEVTKLLCAEGVKGKLWINGSFTTEKIDPDDIDLVLHIQGHCYDKGTEKFRTSIDLLIGNLKHAMQYDTYVAMEYPPDHPLFAQWFWDYAFYHKRWGWSRENEVKGILTLAINGDTL